MRDYIYKKTDKHDYIIVKNSEIQNELDRTPHWKNTFNVGNVKVYVHNPEDLVIPIDTDVIEIAQKFLIKVKQAESGL